jgi:imidazolonepropionase-like amidohydrolase
MSYSLIHNGTLIDGTGRKPIANGAVLLKGNKIHSLGRKSEIPQPEADISMVDAMGGFILPGLIDTHVHLMLEDINIPKMMVTPFSLRFYESVGRMQRTIDAGITTVRDAGGADAGVKQAVDQGLVLGPRMQISITALSITGGHADGWMLSGNIFNLMPSYPGMPTNICDGIEDVRRKVREVLRAGADIIKVCSTGGVLSPTDHPHFTQFTPEELNVIVQEAEYRNGIKVMAHAQGVEGIKNAVRAGIHSIEHGLFLDDEAIELMLNAGTYLVPTLLAPIAVVEIAESAGTMPEYGLKKAREVIEYHADSISRAHKAGVKIAMGTDAGVMPHGTNLRELNLMRSVGMSPQEVIVATTKTAAECMGLEDELGTIEKGKLADVIVVSADPLNNIQDLEDVNNIQLVIKDGQIVKDIRANRPI